MRNAEIAAAFAELGILYELDGANRFRVLAYKDAAQGDPRQPARRSASSPRRARRPSCRGSAKTIQEKIVALLDEGEIPAAAKLKEKFPATLVEITRLPGVGAEDRAQDATTRPASPRSRSSAPRPSRSGLRGVKGLGAKFEENVLAAIDKLEAERPGRAAPARRGPRGRRASSSPTCSAHPASDKVVLAGSARRWAETCKDIDIVATASDPAALVEALVDHELAAEAGGSGTGGGHIRTHNGLGVDLRIVPPAEFGNLLQHFTGSKEHNVKLRERAVQMGLSVSEHGIKDVESEQGRDLRATRTTSTSGSASPTSSRSCARARGEIAAGRPKRTASCRSWSSSPTSAATCTCTRRSPTARTRSTRWSRRRRALGYAYIAVTDHSATHGFGNDVQADALLERVAEIHELDGAAGRRGSGCSPAPR